MVVRKVLKSLIFLIVLFLLVLFLFVVAGYFAVKNFDPNIFRTQLENAVLQQTGLHAELGDIKLVWGVQPEFRIDQIALYNNAARTREKLLQCSSLRIATDLGSIWSKHFLVPQVVIQDPKIFLEKKADGSWNWQTKIPEKIAALPSGSLLPESPISRKSSAVNDSPGIQEKILQGFSSGWVIGFGTLDVKNGTLQLTDATARPVFRQQVDKLELEINPKNVGRVFHFAASGAILAAVQKNVGIEGDLDLMSKSVNFDLRYGQDKIMLKGFVNLVSGEPCFKGELEVRALDLDSVIPASYKNGEYVTGFLNAKVQLSFNGANPEMIKRSLTGQGSLEIRDGAYKNRNLVKEVFDRLSSVIAINQVLGEELPPEVNEMLKGSDTPFKVIRFNYSAAVGEVQISDASMLHQDYQLSGRGVFGIQDQRVNSSLQLAFSKSISDFLVKKIHELAFLSDRNGQVTIPFLYSGILPNAAVQPDLQYVTTKILQSGAEQLLDRGLAQLSKFLEKKKK